MGRVPKEMKVLIVGMLIECFILYGVYQINANDGMSLTKDNVVTYKSGVIDNKYDTFNEEDKKKICYDYEISEENDVCKALDDDTLIVTDKNNFIKEYNYKTCKYEKNWVQLEKGYKLKDAIVSGNKLVYSAIKVEAQDDENKYKYTYLIRYIDTDTGKEGCLFKGNETDEKNMQVKLLDNKLIMLRHVYNSYQIGYIMIDEEVPTKYKTIFRADKMKEKYEIGSIHIYDNKIIWDMYPEKMYSNKQYEVLSYDFESENIENVATYEGITRQNYDDMKTVYYKDKSFLLYKNHEVKSNDIFKEDNLQEKFNDIVRKETEKYREHEGLDEKYNISYMNNVECYDNSVLMNISFVTGNSKYILYNTEKQELTDLSEKVLKSDDVYMEVVDGNDSFTIFNLYLSNPMKKVTIIKENQLK